MACFKPLNAYRQAHVKGAKIYFLKQPGDTPLVKNPEYMRLPCGQCLGCRLEYSRQWATRCMHEARCHEQNCFITLTYDENQIPWDGSLVKPHWQKFMKRLREYARKQGYNNLKFFHAGEYGEQFQRPHYHALIFGFDFPDRELWKMSNDIPLYTSITLDSLWGYGYCSVGDVTFESAAYVARYAVKKINGKLEQKPDPKTGLLPYERVDRLSGQIIQVEKEYATQSRRPGIGANFLDSHLSDIYPWDECIVNGISTRPPRYYDNKFEIEDPDEMESIRQRRLEAMERHAANNTRARLATREKVKKAQHTQLKRVIE